MPNVQTREKTEPATSPPVKKKIEKILIRTRDKGFAQELRYRI